MNSKNIENRRNKCKCCPVLKQFRYMKRRKKGDSPDLLKDIQNKSKQLNEEPDQREGGLKYCLKCIRFFNGQRKDLFVILRNNSISHILLI